MEVLKIDNKDPLKCSGCSDILVHDFILLTITYPHYILLYLVTYLVKSVYAFSLMSATQSLKSMVRQLVTLKLEFRKF